jgi:hypothetical protein
MTGRKGSAADSARVAVTTVRRSTARPLNLPAGVAKLVLRPEAVELIEGDR